jgi:macrolide-specific efflux system membrane fusion protein
VLNASGELEERTVRIGVSNRVQAQVLEGLEDGERVVAGLGSSGAGSSNRPQMPPRL